MVDVNSIVKMCLICLTNQNSIISIILVGSFTGYYNQTLHTIMYTSGGQELWY
jgi:hypothetical protein